MPFGINKEEESWLSKMWRPFMAWQYAAVCIFDFIIAPVLTMVFFKIAGGEYVQWDPLTLKESGFYHLSMAAVLGVVAWTRGKEKIERIMVDYDREVAKQSRPRTSPKLKKTATTTRNKK